MLVIQGYAVTDEFHGDERFIVYSARRNRDDKKVLIKIQKPGSSPHSALRHELELLENLRIPGVVNVLSVEDSSSGPAIVYEDPDCVFLDEIISGGPLEMLDSLRIGIGLSEILSGLHKNSIIHRGIRPSGILVNLKKDRVLLFDFTSSINSAVEQHRIFQQNLLEFSLPYISPEQTGRVNRPVDYRTDFYSLGITLYEMFTGRLPFQYSDILELIHSHVSRTPVPPGQIRQEASGTLSEIIMKLLSKNPEERYQSAIGIMHDLKKCISDYKNKGSIDDFQIASRDVPEILTLPRKLYGRDIEKKQLIEVHEWVRSGEVEAVFVCGYPGIGKTTLVHDVFRPMMRSGGFFIEGKFDQFNHDMPYSAVIQALKDLAKQLLVESREKLEYWKNSLLNALGANAAVIIDVVPEIGHILGQQPGVPSLGPAESKNRFNMAFQNFFRIFSQRENTLVMFIDDLQFADQDSINLIQKILTDTDCVPMLFVGSFRDDGLHEGHPLPPAIEEIKKSGVTITEIALGPLTVTDIEFMLMDMMACTRKACRQLAALVYEKTIGNPFFVNQLINKLYEDRLLYFNYGSGKWEWDLGMIRVYEITENVIDLLVGKIKKLSTRVQELLMTASCVGISFNINILSSILEKPTLEISNLIREAVSEGLVIPVMDSYGTDEEADRVLYSFQHDRVQEAAYFMLPEEKRKRIHLEIGGYMIRGHSEKDIDDRVFDIVNQINKGADLVTDPAERRRFAELNMRAARKAKASTAYQQAVNYLNSILSVLPEDAWDKNYKTTYDLYRESSECEYLAGNHENAEFLFETVLKNARSNIDKADIYNIKIILYANTGRFIENSILGMEALALFGFSFPSYDDVDGLKKAIALEYGEYKSNMSGKMVEDLIDLPRISDPELMICMKILMNMISSAYVSNQVLFAFLGLKSINLSLKHGIIPDSIFAFSAWGLLLGSNYRDYDSSYEFGTLSLRLNDKLNNPSTRCNVPFVFGNFISHWKTHIKDNIKYLREAYSAGIETGDFVYASFTVNSLPRILLSYGHNNLADVLMETNDTLAFLRKIKNYASLERQELVRHAILNLMGETVDVMSLNSPDFDEESHIRKMKDIHYGTGIALYYFYKVVTLFTYGYYEEAHENAVEAVRNLPFISSSFQEADCIFYYALCLSAVSADSSPEKRILLAEEIRKYQERMRLWFEFCPDNFMCRYLLIEAEISRLTGDSSSAMDLYDLAIKSAGDNGFLHITAISNELAARFYFSKGKVKIAKAYFADAVLNYRKWGAVRKASLLEERFINQENITGTDKALVAGFQDHPSAPPHQVPERTTEIIDLMSVIKASQVISGEIALHSLIEKLMKILIENAGAEWGALFIEREGKLVVEARYYADSDSVSIIESGNIELDQNISQSIINYSRRTGETVWINRPEDQGIFSSDPYMIKNRPSSLLSMPIIEQSRIIGLIYLENRLVSELFTPDRMEILMLLSSQAAISLKNALNFNEVNISKEALKKSEENYRALFENIQDLFYRADFDGNILLVSPSIEKILGYTMDEAANMNLGSDFYLHPEKRQDFLAVLREKGYVEDYEVQFRRKDGRIIWIATNSHFYYDMDGNAIGVEGMIRDITQRKLAAELLAAEKERLAVTLKSIGDGVIVTDNGGFVIMMNRVAEELTGWRQEEALGAGLDVIFNTISDEGEENILKRYMKTFMNGDISEYEEDTVIISRDGVMRFITNSVAPIKDYENRILKTQKLESMSIFAGGIAHDFNNILTGIIGNVSLLKTIADKDFRFFNFLNEIEKASLRAKDLTRQLLTFSKGGAPVKKVSSIIDLLMESAGFILTGSNIRSEFFIQDGIWPVEVDEGQINQVINNLVINSVQAMPDGGVIIIKAENIIISPGDGIPLKEGKYVRFSIADQGVGIPKENMDKIFDPFFSTKSKGNGLGLSTTYSIVKRHDGYISVVSEQGSGSVFTVYLPATEGKVVSRRREEKRGSASFRGRILLMDDEDMILRVCSQMLAHLGFEVECVSDGRGAIEKYGEAMKAEKFFDAVIMDLTIPGGMGGRDAIIKLREMDPAVKAIVSSGYSNDPIMSDYANYGFSGIIFKPYKIEDLYEELHRILGG
ncbi:MAG: PAS domain S-box protein [Spirochaetes bacterium]|nr:PAS domain S-box protein [Spirochaetota bacterium]